jgi:hypothetical protein
MPQAKKEIKASANPDRISGEAKICLRCSYNFAERFTRILRKERARLPKSSGKQRLTKEDLQYKALLDLIERLEKEDAKPKTERERLRIAVDRLFRDKGAEAAQNAVRSLLQDYMP